MSIPYQLMCMQSGTDQKRVLAAGRSDFTQNANWDAPTMEIIEPSKRLSIDLRIYRVEWDVVTEDYIQGAAISTYGELPYPGMYRSRLPVTQVSITTGRIGPGCCRSDDDTINMCPTGNNDADLESSGAGGLDTGAVADSTHYHLWLIFNSDLDDYAAMWSLSATAPTMPTGYTKKRRLDSAYNYYTGDSSASISSALSIDFGRLKFEYYEHREGLVFSGSATSFTTVGLGIEVTDTTRLALLEYDCARASNLTGFRVAEYGKDDWAPTEVLGYEQIKGQVIVAISNDATRGFVYRVENAADVLNLWIRGFWSEID